MVGTSYLQPRMTLIHLIECESIHDWNFPKKFSNGTFSKNDPLADYILNVRNHGSKISNSAGQNREKPHMALFCTFCRKKSFLKNTI